jgi:hypothetical protein
VFQLSPSYEHFVATVVKIFFHRAKSTFAVGPKGHQIKEDVVGGACGTHGR